MWNKYKKPVQVVGIALAVYLGIRYLLPGAAPFFIAWIFVRLMYPAASRMEAKFGVKKEWVTLLFLLAGLGLLAVGGWFLGVSLLKQIRSVMERLDEYRQTLDGVLDRCCMAAEQTFGVDGEEVRAFVEQNITLAAERMEVYFVPNLVNYSMEYAGYLIRFVGAFFVVVVAVLLLMKDYDAIDRKMEAWSGYQRMKRVVARLWRMGGDYLKAQAVIILVVIVLCVMGLWIMGNPYALLVGILIGLLDALPFIGTGTILLPWALILVIRKQFFQAAVCATLFLASSTARELLDPKLLGKRLGVFPIVIAAAVYVGIYLYGVAGVLFGPLTLLIVSECVKELNQPGEERE